MKKKLITLITLTITVLFLSQSCKKETAVTTDDSETTITPKLKVNLFNANIYVGGTNASNSSTNPSNPATPYATIQYAVDQAGAGATILIKAGNYYLTAPIVIKNSGTSGNPITIKPQSGVVTISGATSGNTTTPIVPADRNGGLIIIDSKNWITVDGLRLIQSKRCGVSVSGSNNVIVRNCAFEDTYASAVKAARNSSDLVSSNITIFNNTVKRACTDPVANTYTDECISMASVNTFTVSFNTVSDRNYAAGTEPNLGGEGIDSKQECINGQIFNNKVFDLNRLGIYIDGFAKALNNVQVYNNLVYNCGSGIVTAVEAVGGSLNNVRIYNNVIRDCPGPGIRTAGYLQDGPQTNVGIFENTVVRCGLTTSNSSEACGIYLEANNNLNSSIWVKNNIFVNNKTQIKTKAQGTYLTIERNLIFGNNTEDGLTPVKPATLSEVGFVDYPNSNFALTSTSKAKDVSSGTNFVSATDFIGTSRTLYGPAPDLGAYEYKP